MALQGFNETYYLSVKLAQLQATKASWAAKTPADLKSALADAGLTPEQHYTTYGYKEALAPNDEFNAAEYTTAKANQLFQADVTGKYANLAAAQTAFLAAWTGDVYQHYLAFGAAENVNPSNAFDESSYLASKLVALKADPATSAAWATKTVVDVQVAFKAAGLTAVTHYELYGKTEGIAITAVPAAERVTAIGTPGTTYTLTTSADTKVGTANDDTFDGSTSATFSAFDNLDGGAGTDTLNALIATTSLPGGVTVKNIETANISTTGAGLTADVSGWTGLTTVTTTNSAAGVQVIAAAATTNVNASIIDAGAGAVANTVDGGKDIVVTATGVAGGDTIAVGGTTAAAGNITINATLAAGATVGAITAQTTGGTTVSVTETGGTTHAAINVTDGGVSATKAGTLANVTLDGLLATAGSTIVSNALSNLTVANGTGTGNLTITNSLTSAATAHSSVLNLTLNNLGGATTLVDTNAEIGTLNITVAGAATKNSTLAAITDANLSALTVTGAAANTLALTAATGLAGLKTIAVSGATNFTAAVDVSAVATGLTGVTASGTGTVTLGATTVTKGIATTTAYTGGAGNDILTIGATTKAIDLGAGDNNLYVLSGVTALGTGGSVAAGAGTKDTLTMVAGDAATASLTTTFGSTLTGFERFATTTASSTVDVTNLLGASHANYVTVTGAGAALNLKNLVTSGTGATINLNDANTSLTLSGTSGAGASDVLNLNLVDTTTGVAIVAFGTVTANNVETVHLTVNDSHTTSAGTQSVNTATLTDTGLASLDISGNQSLSLVHTGTTLTSLDASGLNLGALTFTSGALQYAATVKGSTSGGDTLNFSAALDSVNITETAGANHIYGGVGADVIVGGTSVDVIYADNGGATHERQTITLDTTANAGETHTYVIAGTSFTVTSSATTSTNVTNLVAAINTTNAAAFHNILTASASGGTVIVDYIQDGNAAAITFASSGTNTDSIAETTAGATGATAKNVLTGGTGADIFVFGTSSAAPSATVFNTINDFTTASDVIQYATALTIVTDVTAATSGKATISAAGVATFVAADSTLALRLTAVEASIQTGLAAAGQSAIFQFGSDAYLFISNGVDGVGAGDQLVKLVGVDTTTTPFDTITLTNGHLTLT